jgi:hypothetical protein
MEFKAEVGFEVGGVQTARASYLRRAQPHDDDPEMVIWRPHTFVCFVLRGTMTQR